MLNMRSRQTFLLCMVVVLLITLAVAATAQTMKFAVPATGPEKNSQISQETGRATYFLFFDNKGDFLEAIKNPASDQPGGISRTVISLLSDSGATILIGESIGDKMKQGLTDCHIDFVKKTGTVDNAVKTVIHK